MHNQIYGLQILSKYLTYCIYSYSSRNYHTVSEYSDVVHTLVLKYWDPNMNSYSAGEHVQY